ncbi:MAG: nicotinate-nucleotide adenylyltransferase [Tissierellia bacterium]|nr:nicotinate-nucleotide adenylyltransferase [Tissierellia bacterium]
MKKIGIMGGTFDPIHIGHLLIAEYARISFKLDKILFIPTGNPPHKKKKHITSDMHRYNMVLLATNSNENFLLSTIEMDRKGVTYTIDTINALKSIYDNTDFYFIMGADSLLQIYSWKDYEKLLNMCKFIVAKRPGYKDNKLDEVKSDLNLKYNSQIFIMEGPLLDISSSQIRERVKKGISITYLVPRAVEIYIYKHKLYS